METEKLQNNFDTNNTLASKLLENRKLHYKGNVENKNISKSIEDDNVSKSVEDNNIKKSEILKLAERPTVEKKEPEYSEDIKKEIDNYKKQINDIKSNFHKSNIKNKLINKKIEDLYEKGDIDDEIKNSLCNENDEPLYTEEEQSIYEWDDLMEKASVDLNKRYEYTKDDKIDKYSDAFMHYLYNVPKNKGLEIMDYLKNISKKNSVEKAVSEMLELGESYYNDGMADFFDNEGNIKKTISIYQKKLKETMSELDKLKKDNQLMEEELKKYKDINIKPIKDYKSSGSGESNNNISKITPLMRAKNKVFGN